jgi:glycosyltransferase involved in cell wall biosynthesis
MGSRAQATRFARWYMSTIYLRQFDAHIANSSTADELRMAAERHGPDAWLHWRHRDHIHVLPLGVDRSTFGPARRSASCRAELLRRAGGDPSDVLVFFGGRLSPEKHAHWVLPAVTAALSRGLPVCLVVAGDGPLREEIAEQLAVHLAGRSLLLEHIRDRAALAEIVASADVFLHPNPREPFGLGPLEAMASGVPIVLPRAGGVLAYATDQNAWLADASPAGLGDALVRALSNPGARQARVQRALADTGPMDWSRVARRFFQTYDHIHVARLALDQPGAPPLKQLGAEPAFAGEHGSGRERA